MGRARKGLAAFAGCLAALALAASPAAAAGVRYEGRTSQGQKMNLRTNQRGEVTRGFIFWHANCRHGKGFRNSSEFRAPLDRAGPNRFRERSRYSAKDGDLKARYEASIVGRRKSPRRFKGTFELTVRFFEDGVKYETCRVRDVTWSVTRVKR